MAKYSLVNTGLALTGFANATGMTDGAYPFAIQGASGTQKIAIMEIYIGGQSTSSAVSIMLFARDSTVAATLSAGTGLLAPALIDYAATASGTVAVTGNSANTTDPQRATAGVLLNLTHNSFGGIVRWVPSPGEEIYMIGNTQPGGELSLSAFTGTPGTVGAHAVYEAF